jgi:hypothetical protein
MEHAERVAGGVIGDGVREGGTAVGDVEAVNEEFGEFEDAGQEGLDLAEEDGVVLVAGDEFVVFTHHGDAGSRGDADELFVFEELDEAADERDGLAVVAGVVVHLAAAGLLEGEGDGVAKALQDTRAGDAGLREERVVIAGDKEGNAQEILREGGRLWAADASVRATTSFRRLVAGEEGAKIRRGRL